jgi:hypothetical protein
MLFSDGKIVWEENDIRSSTTYIGSTHPPQTEIGYGVKEGRSTFI